MKTAIVIGATGLVGNKLIKLLCANNNFEIVKVFHRRAIDITHPKIEFHLIDFDNIKTWNNKISGDVLFSALGTTLKSAGSKKKQYEVDYIYQYEVAKAAAENGVKTYVLVSAKGANADSLFFYMKTKGALELDTAKLPFQSLFFIRPNLLIGDRANSRTGEKVGEVVLNVLNAVGILTSQKPIDGKDVAKKMLEKSLENKNAKTVVEGADLKNEFDYRGKNIN